MLPGLFDEYSSNIYLPTYTLMVGGHSLDLSPRSLKFGREATLVHVSVVLVEMFEAAIETLNNLRTLMTMK